MSYTHTKQGTRAMVRSLVMLLLSFNFSLLSETPAWSSPLPQARGGGFNASVEMVRVPVVAIDEEGIFVTGLDKSSFEIKDGGKDHLVDFFVSDADPLAIGILVDVSEGMKPYAEGIRLAVERASNNLRPDDEIFLATYGSKVTMLAKPTADKLQVAPTFTSAENTYWQATDRALYDAIELGLSTLERSTYEKRSLLIIGADGDTVSNAGELVVQQHIHRVGVTIHAVVLSQRQTQIRNTPSRVNRLQTLPEIVRYTGGLLAQRPRQWGRFVDATGWIQASATDITTYVKHQYLLHYAPQNPPRPGTWRSIRVAIEGNPEKVRARSGYIR